jgi:hypothetical protein
MANTMQRGLVATDDPLANDLIVSMRRQVAYLDVDTTQFYTMLDRISTEEAKSFKEEWLLGEFLPTNLSLAATAAAGDTVLTFQTGEGNYLKGRDGCDRHRARRRTSRFRLCRAGAGNANCNRPTIDYEFQLYFYRSEFTSTYRNCSVGRMVFRQSNGAPENEYWC